jgi:hypothetical protein
VHVAQSPGGFYKAILLTQGKELDIGVVLLGAHTADTSQSRGWIQLTAATGCVDSGRPLQGGDGCSGGTAPRRGPRTRLRQDYAGDAASAAAKGTNVLL